MKLSFSVVPFITALILGAASVFADDFVQAFKSFQSVITGSGASPTVDANSLPKLIELTKSLQSPEQESIIRNLQDSNKQQQGYALDRIGLALYTKLSRYPEINDADIKYALNWCIVARGQLY
ncbi:hypothetical protein H4219_006293 [Mycoemilia scoparia]|uniref:Uncharacterized protein n=1 Tax=Mycoemilia scoparia TaxID=417184 RepID=A0A9W7ZJZ0_9FUNG|nr:hypothetical protein H4219_006293 [Mycoemilia scoparia]